MTRAIVPCSRPGCPNAAGVVSGLCAGHRAKQRRDAKKPKRALKVPVPVVDTAGAPDTIEQVLRRFLEAKERAA